MVEKQGRESDAELGGNDGQSALLESVESIETFNFLPAVFQASQSLVLVPAAIQLAVVQPLVVVGAVALSVQVERSDGRGIQAQVRGHVYHDVFDDA